MKLPFSPNDLFSYSRSHNIIFITQSYSQDGPPVYYAEINVLTKNQNKVQEPSSTEDISHHVYAILEQPSPQVELINTYLNIAITDLQGPAVDREYLGSG